VAKTYEDIVFEARELLQDTAAEKRFTDQTLVNHLNRGLQELGRIRPDAFYDLFDANDLNVPTVIPTGTPTEDEVLWTDDFPLEGQFFPPLVAYLVGVAEVTDDEFTLEGRAMMLLTQFRNTVIGL
jgi:hypothetical protein